MDDPCRLVTEFDATCIARLIEARFVPERFSTSTALSALLEEIVGGQCTRVQQVQFLRVASPIARRIVLAKAAPNTLIEPTVVNVANAASGMRWLDLTDPLTAAMIDLHYVGGLSIKETAAALDLSPATVIRELRFAVSWFRIVISDAQQPISPDPIPEMNVLGELDQ